MRIISNRYIVCCLSLFHHSVTSLRGKSEKRPKSCTAPGLTLREDHGHTHQQLPVSGNPEAARKRSYSAVLPRPVPDNALGQLLSISRHTALLPERGGEVKGQGDHAGPGPHAKTLPETVSVATQAEFMKIEMRGLRKDSSRNSSKKAASHTGHLPQHGNDRTTTNSQISKLPSIPDPSLESTDDIVTRLVVTVTKSPVARETHHSDSERERPSGPRNSQDSRDSQSSNDIDAVTAVTREEVKHSPPQLNIVSLGEKKEVGRMTAQRGRRHSSGKGRLSQGWLPPQPILALKGSPIHTTTKKVGVGGVAKDEERRDEKGGRAVLSPTTSMTINVNVSEFLTQTEGEV